MCEAKILLLKITYFVETFPTDFLFLAMKNSLKQSNKNEKLQSMPVKNEMVRALAEKKVCGHSFRSNKLTLKFCGLLIFSRVSLFAATFLLLNFFCNGSGNGKG